MNLSYVTGSNLKHKVEVKKFGRFGIGDTNLNCQLAVQQPVKFVNFVPVIFCLDLP